MARASKKRTWLQDWRGKIALLLGALLVALVVAEGTLWALDIPSTGPFLQEFYAFAESEQPGQRRLRFKLMCYDSNPTGCLDIDLRDAAQRARYQGSLGDEFSRHWEKTPYAVSVQYNAFGVRDREFGPPDEDVWRIAIVGDSFTYGHGLPEADSYPRQLETLLRQRLPDRRLEVLNCGRGGDNMSGIVRLSSAILDSLQPDVLVYGYFLNDPRDVAQLVGDQDADVPVHEMLEADWLYRERTATRFSLGARPLRGPRFIELVRRMLEQRSLTPATLDWYRNMHGPAVWKRTAEVLGTMNQMARDRDCRFVLAFLPHIWKLDEYPLADIQQKIVTESRALGIETIDGLLALRGHGDEELMLHPRDRHPNPTYARLIAEALADVLAQR